ncbi:hypothetical protein HDV02_000773, partial [Globomyces sp. JEL0801]
MNQKITTISQYQPETLENDKKLFDSMLVKTLNMFVAGSEIGAPEIASTLLGFPDHFTGTSFCTLDWKNWDLWLCMTLGESYNGHNYESVYSKSYDPLNEILRKQFNTDNAETLDDLYVPRDSKMDYLYRPSSLESM